MSTLDWYWRFLWPNLAIALAFFPVEYFLTSRKQKPSINVRVFNTLYIITFIPFSMYLFQGLYNWGKSFRAFPAPIDFNFITGSWPAQQIFFVLLVTFVNDFGQYWFHRMFHFRKHLWLFHKLHHSEEELNVTTAQRIHWAEALLRVPFISLPLVYIFNMQYSGAPSDPTLMMIFSGLVASWVPFIHSDTRIGFGKLGILLTSPQHHRLHHSTLPQHQNKNFALFFPVIDYVFGTYVSPKAGEYPPCGIPNYRENTVLDAHIQPFKSFKSEIKNWFQKK